jgi:hypothetical protein
MGINTNHPSCSGLNITKTGSGTSALNFDGSTGIYINGGNGSISGAATAYTITIAGAVVFNSTNSKGDIKFSGGNVYVNNSLLIDGAIHPTGETNVTGFTGTVRKQIAGTDYAWLKFRNGILVGWVDHNPGETN